MIADIAGKTQLENGQEKVKSGEQIFAESEMNC